MQVFLFQSLEDTEIVAFTSQRNGANLPLELFPWTPRGQTTLRAGDNVGGVENETDPVLNGIRRNGYFLARQAIYPAS